MTRRLPKSEASRHATLKRLRIRVRAHKEHVPITTLRRMCASQSAIIRLTSLLTMRRQIEHGRGTIGYMRLGRKMIDDKDNTCRWQALIVVGEFIGVH